MCLAEGSQHSDASEARTHGPMVPSQPLYHWVTALPTPCIEKFITSLPMAGIKGKNPVVELLKLKLDSPCDLSTVHMIIQ